MLEPGLEPGLEPELLEVPELLLGMELPLGMEQDLLVLRKGWRGAGTGTLPRSWRGF